MMRRTVILAMLLGLALAACAPAMVAPTPTPRLTPTITYTPAPTPIPSPTPTGTPIPPLNVSITWPAEVSALAPVPIDVAVVPPPGVEATARVRAIVLDPEGWPWQIVDLRARGAYRYASDLPLQLPLEPLPGDWRLAVSVTSDLAVTGQRNLVFQPEPLEFHELGDALPAGATLRVPRVFTEVAAQGDDWAGGRAWRYGDGEVALWWAPGPTEALQFDNAEVMLAATWDPAQRPDVLTSQALDWQGQPAFFFREQWPNADSGSWRGNAPGGAAEAWVIQGPDQWLYVLRIRGVGIAAVPPLMRMVAETFGFSNP